MSVSAIENIRRAWQNHCDDNPEVIGEHFPRDIMLLGKKSKIMVRRKVENFAEFFEVAWNAMGKASVYTNVYCEKCRFTNTYGRIFIDFDNQIDMSISQSFADVKKIMKQFPNAQVYFTGKAGFAAYIYFKPVHLKYPKQTIRDFVRFLETDLGLKTIDWHVIGDTNRVSRLPYTVNIKPEANDRLCLPINPNWTNLQILAQANKVTEYSSCFPKLTPGIETMLESFDKDAKEEYSVPNFTKSSTSKLLEVVHQVVEYAPNVKDGRHRIMFNVIVPRLIMSGASDNEVLGTCKLFIERSGQLWKDYESYVKQDIDHTRKRVEKGEPIRLRLDRLIMEFPEMANYFKVPQTQTALPDGVN